MGARPKGGWRKVGWAVAEAALAVAEAALAVAEAALAVAEAALAGPGPASFLRAPSNSIAIMLQCTFGSTKAETGWLSDN
ncbi:MAG: hypothetical protein JWM80_794 [Cyanobacteria bacterium RYN_339]|nr:hypothetical protein [Cyanobacteria bacterium RYN_339]